MASLPDTTGERLPQGRLQALMGVAGRKLHALEASVFQLLKQLLPALSRLSEMGLESKDFSVPVLSVPVLTDTDDDKSHR